MADREAAAYSYERCLRLAKQAALWILGKFFPWRCRQITEQKVGLPTSKALFSV